MLPSYLWMTLCYCSHTNAKCMAAEGKRYERAQAPSESNQLRWEKFSPQLLGCFGLLESLGRAQTQSNGPTSQMHLPPSSLIICCSYSGLPGVCGKQNLFCPEWTHLSGSGSYMDPTSTVLRLQIVHQASVQQKTRSLSCRLSLHLAIIALQTAQSWNGRRTGRDPSFSRVLFPLHLRSAFCPGKTKR